MIIGMGKRAKEEEVPWSWDQKVTQASPRTWSEPDYLSTSLQPQPGLPPTPAEESEVHQELTTPIQPPSSVFGELQRPTTVSGGTELPWYSSGDTGLRLFAPGRGSVQPVQPGTTSQIPPASSVRTKTNKWVPTPEAEAMQRPPYAFGGTELPWYSSGDTGLRLSTPGRGGVQPVKPGTTGKNPPASSVRTKTNKWVPTADAETSSGEIRMPAYASSGTEPPRYSSFSDDTELPLDQPGTTSKIKPASPVGTAGTWAASTTEVPPARASSVGTEMEANEIGAVSSSSGEIRPASPPPQLTPVSSSIILPLSKQEVYLVAQTPAKQQIPQSTKSFSSFSKSFLNKSKNFLSKSKSISSNLASKSKNLFSKFIGKLRFWPRMTTTASGAVNAARRESHGLN